MKTLSLKRKPTTENNLSTLKSRENSFTERVIRLERREYKILGLVMKSLYKLGYKMKWKQPLSKDIYNEIRQVLPHDLVTSRHLYDALGYHVRSVSYLLKMREGVFRYDIRGKKAGVVTAEESKYSLTQLLEHHADYMRDRRKRKNKVIIATKPQRNRRPKS